MNLGKVDPGTLDELLGSLPDQSRRLLVGPAVGEDTAVIDLDGLGDSCMVVSSDPISGAEREIGRYAVHVNANDVATAGARPSLFVCNLLMRESSDIEDLRALHRQICEECRGLGVSVIGGHTEFSPIGRTIVSGTMMGFVARDRLARRPVRAGDAVVLTKGAGIEGTSIIAEERGDELLDSIDDDTLERARSLRSRISVVPEAMAASGKEVRRMHDPTEGGVLGGLLEMCTATAASFRVESDRIPIPPETSEICRYFDLDPLKLIGSGSLLCILQPQGAAELREELIEMDIECAEIGEVRSVGDPRLVLVEDGSEREVSEFPADELWRVITDRG
jgi:hydrogenase maturation factor